MAHSSPIVEVVRHNLGSFVYRRPCRIKTAVEITQRLSAFLAFRGQKLVSPRQPLVINAPPRPRGGPLVRPSTVSCVWHGATSLWPVEARRSKPECAKSHHVRVSWMPKDHAILATRGAEVSGIQFSDGTVQYLPNTHFEEIEK
jgi:hypothetical protein